MSCLMVFISDWLKAFWLTPMNYQLVRMTSVKGVKTRVEFEDELICFFQKSFAEKNSLSILIYRERKGKNPPFRFQSVPVQKFYYKNIFEPSSTKRQELDKRHIVTFFLLLKNFVKTWKQLLNKDSSRKRMPFVEAAFFINSRTLRLKTVCW